MMRKLSQSVLLISLLCCTRFAAAQCTFHITAMAFGSYTGGEAALPGTATGSWTGTCSGNWDIPLNQGTGQGASETTRYMTGPNNAEIAYGVYQDAAHTVNWGNTAGTEKTGDTYGPVTFYGLITAGQYPTPGTYTDTLSTATQSFNVSVTVVSGCAVAATNLAFGADQLHIDGHRHLHQYHPIQCRPQCRDGDRRHRDQPEDDRPWRGFAALFVVPGLWAQYQLGQYRRHGYRGRDRLRGCPGSHRLWPASSGTGCHARCLHRYDYRHRYLLTGGEWQGDGCPSPK